MRVLQILSRTCMLLGLLMVAVTLAPPRWYIAMLAGPWKAPNQGVLIVLSGDGVNESMLGQSSYWRSVYAVWAWREGHFHHLLISGDIGITASMRNFIVSQGVPAETVVMEDRSNSTHENATFSAPVLRGLPGPYVLLTSDYHMLRARRSFSRAGITVEPRPLPDASKRITLWTARWPVFLDLIIETSKIGYYRARGWI